MAGNADHVRDAAFVQGKQERGYTPFMQKGSPTKTSNPSLSEASGGAASVATGSSSSSSGGGSGGDAPTSGTRSHHGSRGNLADAGTGKATGVPGKPTVGVVATQSQGVKFGEDLGEALREMRKDASTTRWVLGTYQGGSISNPIVLAGKGEGGIDDVKKLLTPDVICYGIKRVTDMIDGHPTTKFAHFVWIGNAVSIMSKAKISTHKGAIGEFFAPFHVDLTVSEHRELSDSIIHDKVAAYSGSKSHVK
nr:hypothetical protein HK105_003345 [Polyrhizophydium stewartii]